MTRQADRQADRPTVLKIPDGKQYKRLVESEKLTEK